NKRRKGLLTVNEVKYKINRALLSASAGNENELEENALCRSGSYVCFAGRFVHKAPSPIASQSHLRFDLLRERDDANSVATQLLATSPLASSWWQTFLLGT